MALWTTVSTSRGHNGCKSARSWAAACLWLSRASPRRSTRMVSSLPDCEVMMDVSSCSCNRLMKWLRVAKPVETRAAEVVALMAMRMHSKVDAWHDSGTRPCLMDDFTAAKSCRRVSTLVEGFLRAARRAATWSSMAGKCYCGVLRAAGYMRQRWVCVVLLFDPGRPAAVGFPLALAVFWPFVSSATAYASRLHTRPPGEWPC